MEDWPRRWNSLTSTSYNSSQERRRAVPLWVFNRLRGATSRYFAAFSSWRSTSQFEKGISTLIVTIRFVRCLSNNHDMHSHIHAIVFGSRCRFDSSVLDSNVIWPCLLSVFILNDQNEICLKNISVSFDKEAEDDMALFGTDHAAARVPGQCRCEC
jgi:hypothetical protein